MEAEKNIQKEENTVGVLHAFQYMMNAKNINYNNDGA